MYKGIKIFMAAFLIAAVVPSGAQTITKLESGWKFPETSVGWYRKAFTFTKAQVGHHFTVKFDGIFRDAYLIETKGPYIPDGNISVKVSLDGPGRIISFGNGDPAGSEKEQSADGKTCVLSTFGGLAQVLVLGDGSLQIKEKTI